MIEEGRGGTGKEQIAEEMEEVRTDVRSPSTRGVYPPPHPESHGSNFPSRPASFRFPRPPPQ